MLLPGHHEGLEWTPGGEGRGPAPQTPCGWSSCPPPPLALLQMIELSCIAKPAPRPIRGHRCRTHERLHSAKQRLDASQADTPLVCGRGTELR